VLVTYSVSFTEPADSVRYGVRKAYKGVFSATFPSLIDAENFVQILDCALHFIHFRYKSHVTCITSGNNSFFRLTVV